MSFDYPPGGYEAARAGIGWGLNPSAYGAVGDNVTDDTNAINAYLDAVRANSWKVVNFNPGAKHYVTGSLNFTGLSRVWIRGNGALIRSTEATYPIVDMLKSNNCTMEHLRITGGSQGSPCTRGLQIGLLESNQGYPENLFVGVQVDGYFTDAAFINQNSEVCASYTCEYINRYPGGTCYAIILDGSKHWPFVSEFQTSARSADTFVSFNSSEFYACKIYSLATTGTAGCVWMCGGADHKFVGGYAQTAGAYPAVTIYMGGSGASLARLRNFVWSVHTEIAPSSLIYFTGTANPVVEGLRLTDHLCQVQNVSGYALARDSGTVSGTITMYDTEIRLYRWSNSGARLVDNPASYQIEGKVWISEDHIANFNQPTLGWIGLTLRSSNISSWNMVGTATDFVAGNTKRTVLGRVFHGKVTGTTLSNGGTTSPTIGSGLYRYSVSGGTIASHTITLPTPSTATDQVIQFMIYGTITALTINATGGSTVFTAITSTTTFRSFVAHCDGTNWWVG